MTLDTTMLNDSSTQTTADLNAATSPATTDATVGQVYDIGLAGSPYQNLSDLDWGSLQPGDTVRIHWRAEPYSERLLLDIQGTVDHPIIIEGVAGPNGERPVLDANGATTDSQFQGFDATWRQDLGGSIYIGATHAYPSAGEVPANIVIRGFEITGAGQGNSFTDAYGVSHVSTGQPGIFVMGGTNIVIEDNYIHNNSMGVFSDSNQMYEITENLIVRNNTFVDNGEVGSYLYHHVYTEGLNTLIEGNTFGEKIPGDFGSLLKMRDVGLTVRYNDFGSSPGHIIDLVEVESDALKQMGYATSDAFHNDNYVYGNTIDATTGNIHFGGDKLGKENGDGEGTGLYRETLYFHDNTLTYHSDASDTWRIGILRVPNADETVHLSNNTFIASSATAGATPTHFGLLDGNGNLDVDTTNTLSSVIGQYTDLGPGTGTITGWAENISYLDGAPDTSGGSTGTGGGTPDVPPADGLTGGDGNDSLFCGASDDPISGGNGDDLIYGGDGNDTIDAGNGNDMVFGEAGNDLITGGQGDDTLMGGDGDDTIAGGAGMDSLEGGQGADRFVFTTDGLDATDAIKGFNVAEGDAVDLTGLLANYHAGTDNLADFVKVETQGYDTVISVDVDGGGDSFVAVARLEWAGGLDLQGMVDGGNLIVPAAPAQAETLPDAPATDPAPADVVTIAGTDGNDALYGGADAELFTANAGDDVVYAGMGNDTIEAGAGNDLILAEGGNDRIEGGAGDDTLMGGEGNDTIVGGAGADSLYGDGGADTFAFGPDALDAADHIKGFNASEGDAIDLSALLQAYHAGTDNAANFVHVETQGYHTVISVDVDGGGDHFVDVATLEWVTGLSLQGMLNEGSLIL